jgi:hypothetical protein
VQQVGRALRHASFSCLAVRLERQAFDQVADRLQESLWKPYLGHADHANATVLLSLAELDFSPDNVAAILQAARDRHSGSTRPTSGEGDRG